MQKVIIIDIDGTVADASKRLHYITEQTPKDYESFYAEVIHDIPIEPTCCIIKDIIKAHPDFLVFWVTGRRNSSCFQTEAWLRDQHFPIHKMFMRDDDDHRKDYVVKEEVVDKILKDGYQVFCAFDDRASNVKMYRSKGITCYQVADGEY